MEKFFDFEQNDLDFIKKNNLSTPITFFSEKRMLEAYNIMKSNLSDNAEIFYALKSCYNIPLLKSIASLGVGAEILSELELNLALKANFKKVLLNGMGRNYKLFEKTIFSTKSCIIVDSISDIINIEKLAQKYKTEVINVGIRYNLFLKKYKQNNYYFSQNHKLGNNYPSVFFEKFFNLLTNNNNIKWDVFHCHFTINELSDKIYISAIRKISNIIRNIQTETNFFPKRIDIGGGIEVFNPNKKYDYAILFKNIFQIFNRLFPSATLILEPGRYLSGYAGYTLGRVLDIKQLNNKYWIITDIGTNTLIPISNARYTLESPQPKTKGINVGITDGITSPTNNLIYEVKIEKLPQIGDYICISNTGAYTDVYSTFWGYPPHQVCFKDKNNNIKITRNKDDIEQLYNIFFK